MQGSVYQVSSSFSVKFDSSPLIASLFSPSSNLLRPRTVQFPHPVCQVVSVKQSRTRELFGCTLGRKRALFLNGGKIKKDNFNSVLSLSSHWLRLL